MISPPWDFGRFYGRWSSAKYKLHDHKLTKVAFAKYLGVAITEDLKWDSNINDIVQKLTEP